jgi:hypothetical protein
MAIGDEAGIVKRPPWRSASVASRWCRGEGVRSAFEMRGKQKREIEENEEDGGENGKRARDAGLYSGSGGKAAPSPKRER